MQLRLPVFHPAAWSLPTLRLAWPRPAAQVRAAPVVRLFALGLAQGQTQAVQPLTGRMQVHCRHGRVWITHDGQAGDVVLDADESYAVDCTGTMRLHALAAAGVEIQVD